ncbi:MAG TPA: selenocysteine-specific translation elongation factor [Jatrophihabitans sp.]|nr:selenocysteine-specific translation elongation factor [Jatrophihabitans sp.]
MSRAERRSVVATAGHVDHGKSALIRALTGIEPDRWAEERRRGLTIDLGFAWTELAQHTVAFVDVPGHQRFVSNMLAGVGPVPAVLFVVAADDGWSRQSTEHLDALGAFGIRDAIVVVTKADLVDPDRAAAVGRTAADRLVDAGLDRPEVVVVSAATGLGLSSLRERLVVLLDRLPVPDPIAPVRFWIDRVFTVRGAGTVVTGTLGAGRISIGDRLEVLGSGQPRPVTVRAIEQLGKANPQADAVSRVGLNLRAVTTDDLARGACLLTPGAWPVVSELDVRLEPIFAELTSHQVLHVGSAAIPARVRPLADGVARLTLARPVPVRVGDRAVLRDPGQQAVTAGVVVLDPDPPALNRRGAAAARGASLHDGTALTTAAQLARRGAVRADRLRLLGFPDDHPPARHGWLIDDAAWRRWQDALRQQLDAQVAADPRRPWLSTDAARRAIGLPDQELLTDLVGAAGLQLREGRISLPGARQSLGRAGAAIEQIVAQLQENPFAAPERTDLQAAGVSVRDLATAAETGLLTRLAPDLVIGNDAVTRAVELLSGLAQPFTLSQARQRWGTTRRVAVPLLELLDRQGLTIRDPDDRRRLRQR